MSKYNLIALIRPIDRYIIGGLVFLLFPLKYLFFSQRSTIVKHPKKILVIRLWALGSSLLTFPMIQRLQNHYGKWVEYHLLASSRNIGVFKNQGYFIRTWNLFNPKDVLRLIFSFKSYDVVIDAEEYFRISALMTLWLGKISTGYGNLFGRKIAYTSPVTYEFHRHNLLNCLALLGPLGISTTPPDTMEPLVYSEKKQEKVNILLADYRGKICLAFHAGWAETAPERFWNLDNWVKLTESVVAQYGDTVRIFFTGTAFEQASIAYIFEHLSPETKKQSIDTCGKMSIFELAPFFEGMDVVVSNDTGPMHLAAAMGTRTIGLFGPELPERFGPYPAGHNIGLYRGDGNPSILVHLGKYITPKERFVDRITPEEVRGSIEQILLGK